jgi:predicted O-methyltransferase YrrM
VLSPDPGLDSTTMTDRMRELLRPIRSRPLPTRVIDAVRLRRLPTPSFPDVAARSSIDMAEAWADGDRVWTDVASLVSAAGLDQNPEGVSAGDRRAISSLAAHLRPRNVLEIGTHTGSSTLALAAALKGDGSRITMVDVTDVNDPITRPWGRFGAPKPPKEIVNGLAPVEFVVSDSLDYLRCGTRRFDLIFLDGDHGADTVYQELPLALARLELNGVVLLHDYFPGGQPLLTDERPILGPYLATRRLIHEGLPVRVQSLGDLPWPTTRGTHVTSLAVVLAA